MKLKEMAILASIILLPSFQLYASTLSTQMENNAAADTGYITTVYTPPSGGLGIQLSEGFPQADKASVCPNNGGWAMVETPSSAFTSLILAAKATHNEVKVTTTGCDSKSGHLLLTAAYML